MATVAVELSCPSATNVAPAATTDDRVALERSRSRSRTRMPLPWRSRLPGPEVGRPAARAWTPSFECSMDGRAKAASRGDNGPTDRRTADRDRVAATDDGDQRPTVAAAT